MFTFEPLAAFLVRMCLYPTDTVVSSACLSNKRIRMKTKQNKTKSKTRIKLYQCVATYQSGTSYAHLVVCAAFDFLRKKKKRKYLCVVREFHICEALLVSIKHDKYWVGDAKIPKN